MRNVGYASIAVLLSMGLAGCGGGENGTAPDNNLKAQNNVGSPLSLASNFAGTPSSTMVTGFNLQANSDAHVDGLLPFASVLIGNAIAQTERAMALSLNGELALRSAQARFTEFLQEGTDSRFVPCDDSMSVKKNEVIFDQTEAEITDKSLVRLGEVDPRSETVERLPNATVGDQSATLINSLCKQGDFLVQGNTGNHFLELVEQPTGTEDGTNQLIDLKARLNTGDSVAFYSARPSDSSTQNILGQTRGSIDVEYRRERAVVVSTDRNTGKATRSESYSPVIFARASTKDLSSDNSDIRFIQYMEEDLDVADSTVESALSFDLLATAASGSNLFNFLSKGTSNYGSTLQDGNESSLEIGSGSNLVHVENLTYRFAELATAINETEEVEASDFATMVKNGLSTGTLTRDSSFVKAGAQGLITKGQVKYEFSDGDVTVTFNEATVTAGEVSQVLTVELALDGVSGDPIVCEVERADLTTTAFYKTSSCNAQGLSERLVGFIPMSENLEFEGQSLAGGANAVDQVLVNDLCTSSAEMNENLDCAQIDGGLADAIALAESGSMQAMSAAFFTEDECTELGGTYSEESPTGFPSCSTTFDQCMLNPDGPLPLPLPLPLPSGNIFIPDDIDGVGMCYPGANKFAASIQDQA